MKENGNSESPRQLLPWDPPLAPRNGTTSRSNSKNCNKTEGMATPPPQGHHEGNLSFGEREVAHEWDQGGKLSVTPERSCEMSENEKGDGWMSMNNQVDGPAECSFVQSLPLVDSSALFPATGQPPPVLYLMDQGSPRDTQVT